MRKTAGSFGIIFLMVQPSKAAPLSFAEFNQLARECAPSVAPSTLGAIAKVESQFDPLVLHDNTTGETLHGKNPADATQSVNNRVAAGHSVDVGLMQVNSKNFANLGLTAGNAINPCVSLSAAADLLVRHYSGGDTVESEQLAIRRAISAYNTGNPTRGFANGYVRRVEVAAQLLVPPLAQSGKKGDRDERSPEEPWNVWGSYDRSHSAVGSSAPPEAQQPNERKSPEQDQVFEPNDGDAP
ncbi:MULTISPECIES: type IV secretion system lytic transglycosylase VirB1 [Rhizobium/Agrobacterium group]|uniref:Rcorf121 n=5 Tax=Rhizobium/Agrobacterium group TaxID=227290 RepID=Q9F5A2_RHIRH|nr:MULTISPECIES: type IV secretion system lytic transglycosylase VirB1 [Rhizobium/Agrobacterium group]ABW33678.1 rcorf121 [Rhizobium rhizogenes]AQS65415.1 type IV secretion system lytic transglycosylase VirB1 [Rhizobium rhizogenes]ASK42870.1 lytic transglycosylase [Rhizobium rhizogenes]MCZ7445577.1 type IV secretion system lytic transglycosylase VirB1 [Rhizobium rhizogenes]MCZ7472477.1 type IV secretion system lytic transglycosylase VirB1 [Rhizobium rhizogenes]